MRVFKRGDVYHCYVYENGVRRSRSTFCHDKKAAEAVARTYERDAADPDHAVARGAMMRDALGLLLERAAEDHRAKKRAADTVAFYQRKVGHLARIFEPKDQPFPLAQLRARHVDDYITQRRSEPAHKARKDRKPGDPPIPRVADATIAKELGALARALRLAKRAGIWKGDVEEVMPVDFGTGYTPRKRWLPHPEIQKLLAELSPDRAARVAFIVATSASWGESDRARREDVDVKGGMVHVRGTKRATRLRDVPIVTDDQVGLVQHALANGAGVGGLLFLPWQNVRRDLQAACERAGIEPCSPNDLRRTFAHWMRGELLPMEHISPAMGHSTTRMLERTYGRLEGAELAEVMRRTFAAVAASRVRQREATSAESPDSSESKTPQNKELSVPRDGIEPPTRGFSSLVRLWPKPADRAEKVERGAGRASPVRQPGRRGGRS